MDRSSLAIVAVLILTLGLCWGCKSQKSAADEQSGTAQQRVRPDAPASRSDVARDAAPDAGDDSTAGGPATADLLARRTASYSRDLEQLLKKQSHHDSGESTTDQPLVLGTRIPGPTPDPKSASPAAVPVKPVVDAPAPSPADKAGAAPLGQRPASNDPNVALASTAASANTNTPVVIPEPAPKSADGKANTTADALEEKLARRIKDYPRDVASQLDYQLLLFLKDQPVPNLNAIASLPAEDRELVTAIVDGLTNFRSSVRSDANMLLSRKVRPLIEAADRMRSQAELSIPALALCTKVEAFGRYEPIDPPRFPAGVASPAIVYCEIENFSAQFDAATHLWTTDLAQDIVLYTEVGMQVWSDKQSKITDSSRNRRHDFFVRKIIKLPQNLNIGRYVLKVTIVDTQANRVAEASLPVQIVAQ